MCCVCVFVDPLVIRYVDVCGCNISHDACHWEIQTFRVLTRRERRGEREREEKSALYVIRLGSGTPETLPRLLVVAGHNHVTTAPEVLNT